MPREAGVSVARKEATPAEPSFDERRAELFNRIAKDPRILNDADWQRRIVGRVFEHSTEDGLRLAERLAFTPEQYQEAVFTVSFFVKHEKIYREMARIDSNREPHTREERAFRERLEHVGSNRNLNPFHLPKRDAQEELRKEQAGSRTGFLNDVDALYLDALMTREPELKTRRESRGVSRSKSETLAERYLEDVQEVLERRYYTGPVREMFHSVAQDPAFNEPTITEEDLRATLEKYKIRADDAVERLAPARVVAYRGIDAIKRDVAQQGLIKELKENLPEGMTVTLDRDTGQYRVTEIGEKGGRNAEVEKSEAERLAAFEEKVLDEMEKLLKEGADQDSVALGLAGLDSPRSWEIRERLLKAEADQDSVALGLAGLDSPRAWEMRERLLKEGANKGYVAMGLAGLDSPRAWEMRDRLIKERAGLGSVAIGLAGVDSPKAWEMRDRLFNGGKGGGGDYVAMGLAGLDSSRAWEMRERLLKEGTSQDSLARGLAALDSPRAWEMRERLLKEGVSKSIVAESLAGLDSPKAWEMRDRLIKEGTNHNSIAAGFAGLDSPRAWEMRERLRKEGATKESLAAGLAGGYVTFVWRLRPEWKIEEPTGDWQPTLDLLNLVHDPTREGIEAYRAKHPRPSEEERITDRQADVLRDLFSDRDAARALLATNAAVPDRSPERLAEALFRRMSPSAAGAEKPSLWNRVRDTLSPGRSVAGASAEEPSLKLLGGGAENLSDARRVLETREEMDELLAKGIYGRYDAASRSWAKTYFSARREISEPARETTFTLADVAGARRVSLLVPLQARLIVERVKGITKENREVPLEPSVNSLGEATVDVPAGVVKILYSIERPSVSEPMHDPAPREFENFLRAFGREHGNEMTENIARLPHDVEAELRTAAFKSLTPKQKVLRIEAIARRVSWYDTQNQDVSAAKAGKPLEEQVAICEERLEELRAGADPSAFAGKKFAGVCADFAQITCAMLRKAGLPAGIVSGFRLKGKTAEMKDAHATAFVPWPDGRGGIRIVSVDGTPTSADPRAADVARPSLAELEAQAEQAIGADVADAESTIAELLKSAHANDVVSIRKLTNSKLERALNVILRHEVKESHLRVVERMLNAYWYGGLRTADRIAADIELRKALEDEISRERAEVRAPENAAAPAGTRLLGITREFIARFQRGGAAATSADAFDILDRVTSLSENALSDVERRAFAAVVHYLRAQKMR